MASRYNTRMVLHSDGLHEEPAVKVPECLTELNRKIFIECNGNLILMAAKIRRITNLGLAETVQYMKNTGMWIHHADKEYELKEKVIN